MFKTIPRWFHHHYHTRYHGVYKHAKQLFVFDLALLALAIIMLASGIYFTFWKPGVRHLATVQVLLGNDRINSGDAVNVTINYTNISKVVLREPILAARLPAGFIIDRAQTPTTTWGDNSTITLPDILPGAKGVLTIAGRLFSQPKVDDRIVGILTFKAEGSGNREQEAAPFNFNLSDSVLKGALAAATSTFQGTAIPISYTLENTADAPIEHLTLDATPYNHILSASDLKEFTLPAKSRRVFEGVYTPPNNSAKITLTIVPRVNINGHIIPQKPALAAITILNPADEVAAEFLEKPAYAEPGQGLSFRVTWSNKGAFVLKNQIIKLKNNSGVIDLARTAAANKIATDGTDIIITKQERTALAETPPGGAGSADLKIILLPHFNLGEAENSALTIDPNIAGEVTGIPGQKFTADGAEIKLPLATELSWTGQVRYYTDDGEQLGRGPLPPKVGQTTRYWLLFDVYNTTNIVSGASFAARLAPGVVFTGKQSVTLGDKLTYDNAQNLVHWSYAQIPPHSQTGLYFEVAVTPANNQAGQTIPLLEDARFSAKDDLVGKPFTLVNGSLTNILPSSDEGSKKSAIVR